MSQNSIDYEKYTRNAMRQVIRDILADVAVQGLPGEHHFYLSFDTTAEGVMIPDHLRAEYPEEMTIVLQNQFDDLQVNDEGFSVSLSFSGRQSALHVPFEAMSRFYDPSVSFGLVFETSQEMQSEIEAALEAERRLKETAASPEGDAFSNGRSADAQEAGKEASAENREEASAERGAEEKSVISLDAFRNKSDS